MTEKTPPLYNDMRALGQRARVAAKVLQTAPPESRTAALRAMAARLAETAPIILAANARDVAAAREGGCDEGFIDRLLLDGARIDALVSGVAAIAALPDQVGETMAEWTRPNGLRIARVRTPLGVIGMIFESRPNVAADAAALAIRAGNVIILRGGAESAHRIAAVVTALRAALRECNLPEDAVQIVPSADRAAVGMMLQGLDGAVDVIVPRGGKSLVARVREDAQVPVLAHLEGVNHTYIHAAADPQKALDIVVNAKMRRVSVCGATEKLLIDRAIAAEVLPPIAKALEALGCELRGGPFAQEAYPMKPASSEDWRAE